MVRLPVAALTVAVLVQRPRVAGVVGDEEVGVRFAVAAAAEVLGLNDHAAVAVPTLRPVRDRAVDAMTPAVEPMGGRDLIVQRGRRAFEHGVAQSSATLSVMRMPCEYRGACPLAASCSFDLGTKAVDQHHLDAHALDHCQILRQILQFAGGDGLARDANDKGLVAELVDVRRDRPKPGHKSEIEDGGHAGAMKWG